MKTRVVLLLCLVVVLAVGIASGVAAAEPDGSGLQANANGPSFADVPSGSSYYDAVMYLAQRGVMGGYANGLFGPADALRRAQLAKVVVTTIGIHSPSIPSGAATFSDVPNDGATYPFDYVEEAAANALVAGHTDGTFGPYDDVTRIQLIRIVVRAFPGLASPPAGYESGFADVGAEDEPYAAKAKYHGLIEGRTATTLDPYEPATRGLTALVLHAAHSVAGEERPLRVGYDRDFAPFAWEDDAGAARGLSIELVQAACDRAEMEVTFIAKEMAEQADMFARGQLDVVIDEPVTPPGVLGESEFSQHYLVTGAAFLRLLGETPLDLAAAAGMTIVTPGTGPVYPYLQKVLPTATLVAVAGYVDALQAVASGTADAAGLNFDVGYDLAEKLFPGQFGRPGARFMEVGLAMARPKDMGRNFLDSFDAGLAMIRSDGTLAAILGDR